MYLQSDYKEKNQYLIRKRSLLTK